MHEHIPLLMARVKFETMDSTVVGAGPKINFSLYWGDLMNMHVLCLVSPRKESQEMLLKMFWTFGVINKNPRPASK